jgi:hypothetical protein
LIIVPGGLAAAHFHWPESSLWVIAALVLVHALAMRWLRLVCRRLTYDLETAVDRFVLAIITTGLILLYLILSPLLPAPRVCEDIDLWYHTFTVDDEDVRVPITLASLILALHYAIGIGILAKRLPALLEILLSRRFDISAGITIAFPQHAEDLGAGQVVLVYRRSLLWVDRNPRAQRPAINQVEGRGALMSFKLYISLAKAPAGRKVSLPGGVAVWKELRKAPGLSGCLCVPHRHQGSHSNSEYDDRYGTEKCIEGDRTPVRYPIACSSMVPV